LVPNTLAEKCISLDLSQIQLKRWILDHGSYPLRVQLDENKKPYITSTPT